MDKKIDVTDLVEAMPISRALVAFERAARKLGHAPAPEEAMGEEFLSMVETELIDMATADIVAELVDDGLIRPVINDDGSLGYYATEE